jgi:flagellar biosynthesis/type III secretory pathway protein FliH
MTNHAVWLSLCHSQAGAKTEWQTRQKRPSTEIQDSGRDYELPAGETGTVSKRKQRKNENRKKKIGEGLKEGRREGGTEGRREAESEAPVRRNREMRGNLGTAALALNLKDLVVAVVMEVGGGGEEGRGGAK